MCYCTTLIQCQSRLLFVYLSATEGRHIVIVLTCELQASIVCSSVCSTHKISGFEFKMYNRNRRRHIIMCRDKFSEDKNLEWNEMQQSQRSDDNSNNNGMDRTYSEDKMILRSWWHAVGISPLSRWWASQVRPLRSPSHAIKADGRPPNADQIIEVQMANNND